MKNSKSGRFSFGLMAFHLSPVINSLLVHNRNFKHIFLGETDTVKMIRKRGSIHFHRRTCIANPISIFKILRSALVRKIRMCGSRNTFIQVLDMFFPVSENWILFLKKNTRVHSLQSALTKTKTFL